MHRKALSFIVVGACGFAAFHVRGAELSLPVRKVLNNRCVDCHNEELKNGGIDLDGLILKFGSQPDVEDWVRVESAIMGGKMPPPGEERLANDEIQRIQEWFNDQFVTPGGVQHAGPNSPRRLTREEIQNTLEDILHIDIRETVTNSRLHVIPESIIEKFFPVGVLGESGFSNDALTLSKESIDIQSSARCFALVLSLLDSNRKARQHVFGMDALPERLSIDQAREIIDRFGHSAFRRQITKEESDAFVSVFEKMVKTSSPADALKSSFLAVLLSPSFLFRFEEPVTEQIPVEDSELAVRMSYFLWSAPPDATLYDLASSGKLREPEVLRQQVRRMLADPKRIALAENLGGEWFDYKKLRRQSSINKRSDKMAGFYRTQFEEALLFFDSFIRYDQPIFSIVDADWAFMNRHQSGIYRLNTQPKVFEVAHELPGVNIHYRDSQRQVEQGNYEYKHAPLTLVQLQDPNRGGFLTLGPTMSVTATENRTSPIRRGVWVMERILGRHFVVPEDVPDLEATKKKAKAKNLALSHNEILKLHSSQSGCSSCHQYIDPIGFGLEVFDQLGIGRTVSNLRPDGEKLHWTPKQTPKSYSDREWELAEPLDSGSSYSVFFQYSRGAHRLDIKNVRLEAGNVSVADDHFGFTGNAHKNNTWHFSIPANAPKTGWRLIAQIRGNGGTDSHGTIIVSGTAESARHKLPNGKSFASPAELKKHLLADYRDEITENAIRRVLAYALGRKILPIDRPAIRQIKTHLKAHGYRMPALIEAVVLSYPFRYKEN